MNAFPLLARLASASRAALVVGLVAAGCAGPGVSPSVAVPIASPAPSASPAAPTTSVEPLPSTPNPPAAVLMAGGKTTPGAIGSYTWLATGSDAPWLRGTPVAARQGGTATITFEPAVPVAAWRLRKTEPGDTDGNTARQIASGAGPIAFDVPATAGTIQLKVDFAANAGSVNYFWALTPS